MSEEIKGGFLQPIQNREGVEAEAPKEMFDALSGIEMIKQTRVMALEEVIATYGDNLTKAEIEELQKLNNHE
jgi:hypothetical protein